MENWDFLEKYKSDLSMMKDYIYEHKEKDKKIIKQLRKQMRILDWNDSSLIFKNLIISTNPIAIEWRKQMKVVVIYMVIAVLLLIFSIIIMETQEETAFLLILIVSTLGLSLICLGIVLIKCIKPMRLRKDYIYDSILNYKSNTEA